MESLKLTTKILVYSIEECDDTIKKLIENAKNATLTSYAPYSHFNVGAAILLADGTIVNGSNQENAAYPSGLCAERTALFYANAQYPSVAVAAIVIAAAKDGVFTLDPCTPCGSCRQVLLEVENRFGNNVRVIMYGERRIFEVESIKSLLPLSFGQGNLG